MFSRNEMDSLKLPPLRSGQTGEPKAFRSAFRFSTSSRADNKSKAKAENATHQFLRTRGEHSDAPSEGLQSCPRTSSSNAGQNGGFLDMPV
jgi:hypothetical protein